MVPWGIPYYVCLFGVRTEDFCCEESLKDFRGSTTSPERFIRKHSQKENGRFSPKRIERKISNAPLQVTRLVREHWLF